MSIGINEMMPGARNCFQQWAKVKQGEEVVILTDTSVDPWVIEAYRIAAEELTDRVYVLSMNLAMGGSDLNKLVDYLTCKRWPNFVGKSILNADVVLIATIFTHHLLIGDFGIENASDLRDKFGVRGIKTSILSREGLSSEWSRYPADLTNGIKKFAHEAIRRATNGDYENAKVRVTDPEGTDLAFTGFSFGTSSTFAMAGKETFMIDWQNPVVGTNPSKPEPNAEGRLVSSSLHVGPIPTIEITIEKGKAVNLKGGGAIGKKWKMAWEKWKDLSSLKRRETYRHEGPGVNWLEEMMWGTHPKAIRLDKSWQGSPAAHGWMGGTRRSGILHFGFGGGYHENYHHRDIELLFPTVQINNELIIEEGRLIVLDWPETRALASQYGDPDELLTEDWIPSYPKNWMPTES